MEKVSENGTPVRTEAKTSSKMSLEEKRKALQAERLRKEQEMKELLAQEEALLKATEEEGNL